MLQSAETSAPRTFDHPDLKTCGCNSVVECHVANVNVTGSTPVTRSMTSRTTHLGNIGQLAVAAEAAKRGFHVSIPMEGAAYDLILDKDGRLYRVQVKCAIVRDDGTIPALLKDTPQNVDALVIYERSEGKAYWINRSDFTNKTAMSLRRAAPKNNQIKRVTMAEDYLQW